MPKPVQKGTKTKSTTGDRSARHSDANQAIDFHQIRKDLSESADRFIEEHKMTRERLELEISV